MPRNLRQRCGNGRGSGFTLIELLASLAIIGILASLLGTAVAKSKAKAAQAVCLNSERQIALAFMLYFPDFEDVFPAGATGSAMGAHPEDWIWWQVPPGETTMRSGHQSALAPYLGGYKGEYFRCPSDKTALAREAAWRAEPGREQYIYSYSLNGSSEMGMATYISRDRTMIYRNKISQVNRPSQKIMLAEEKGSAEDGPGSAVIDDGRWVPAGYPLTSRHAGKANAAFADGRAALVHRSFADSSNPQNYDPKR